MKKTIFYSFPAIIALTGLALLMGCSDKEKIAAQERIIEEQKKAIEQEKAEAAEAGRRQAIEGVMGFLQGEKFFVLQNAQNAEYKYRSKNIYDNFSYNEDEKALEYSELMYYSTDSTEYEKIGLATSHLFNWKIRLRTASPVVSISDYSPLSLGKALFSPRAKKVTLKADFSSKSVNKKAPEDASDGIQRSLSAIMTEVDLEKLKEVPWEENKGDIQFIVTEEVAPRLKAALEDLLKAHGIQVSKY